MSLALILEETQRHHATVPGLKRESSRRPGLRLCGGRATPRAVGSLLAGPQHRGVTDGFVSDPPAVPSPRGTVGVSRALWSADGGTCELHLLPIPAAGAGPGHCQVKTPRRKYHPLWVRRQHQAVPCRRPLRHHGDLSATPPPQLGVVGLGSRVTSRGTHPLCRT